ncbi:MAG: DUF1998 domain-containing protein [Shewanella psychromarinicola]|uniref:DUF1998 domain-containing protein n=1 Tax=Shewanella psychromarinicola TaxID=2487742 RepID=UPI0030018AD5
MSKKSEVRTRKGQLIHTFGPGAMQVNKMGISMIACGLDYWHTENGSQKSLDIAIIKRFKIQDARLERKLGVSHFRSPPDSIIIHNEIKVSSPLPSIRFPLWHICSNTSCQRMKASSPTLEEELKCDSCGAIMYQSRFISVCPSGHIQDFPWFNWLNTHNNSACHEDTCKLKMIGTGSSSSAGIKIKCITHDSRPVSLAGVFQTKKENGIIYESTFSEKNIKCHGDSTWINIADTQCEQPLVAALRQATNVYFAKTDSSILIPLEGNNKDKEIDEAFENLPASDIDLINAFEEIDSKIKISSNYFSGKYSDEQLESYFSGKENIDNVPSSETEVEYRYQEFNHFLNDNAEGVLVTKTLPVNSFEDWFSDFFSAVTQVKELTVTNAFYGFDRLQPQTSRTIDSYKKSLWKSVNSESNWLPAVKVYGEGLFLEFRIDVLNDWSKLFATKASFKDLVISASQSPLFDKVGTLTPEYLLIHTFSHLLINQLIFDCGYSTASLRERLYVSSSDDTTMYGLLIYTAAGDSEGSLGGLVRMAEQGKLEHIVKKAIESSNWCSSDPICREIGEQGGQGPNGMNLAACHNCALLPETSCEIFNSLLDRGVVTSQHLDNTGFFDSLLNAN